ncbi:putative defensin-like protein 298 [Hibiscus syriacus]|uniref:putative defensin-like protein 298 n=1 Tax=Hibiscus syriacus TaxID=106335 RepID=UPI001922F6BB|nr:putative defensin-like protein 298 [Hibiscus syriacus]
MKSLILLLIVSSMMFSLVQRGRGQVFIPCSSEEDCKAVDCHGGVAHCIKGQCQCTVFEIKALTCSNDFECHEKCGPKANNDICLNGHCLCGASD